MTPLSREQARAFDRRAIHEFHMPGILLMENAGRAAADLLVSLGVRGTVVICCGKGNNGGDGLVMARHLELRGVRAQTLLFADPDSLEGDAAVNYRIVAASGVPLRVIDGGISPEEPAPLLGSADWVVDALFGTGLTGSIRPPLDAVVRAINESPARVLAVDIPSGLDADTGEAAGLVVEADHTVTFVAEKMGFRQAAAARWLGRVHVVDIGAPRILRDS